MSDWPAFVDGAVASTVTIGGRRVPDHNGFVTALAARALRLSGEPVPGALLDVMMRCRSSTGGFRFWPEGRRPGWAPELPDDADDTAIMSLELWRAGRLSLAEARHIACQTIGRHRIRSFGAMQRGWRRPGVFATWHRPGSAPDLVDCTATVNVLALYAATGLWHISGVEESVAMLADALAWAGAQRSRAQSLAPFYPEPAELVLALRHAVDAGACALAPLLQDAEATPWGQETSQLRDDHAVCSSPYGAVIWQSPALARLRRGRADREVHDRW
jgi:hypothetical protein